MDNKEYKEKKLDKLTRDAMQIINKVPSFGYGDTIDAAAKIALSNYFLTIIRAYEIESADVEIFTQSMADEVASITALLVPKIKEYKYISDGDA